MILDWLGNACVALTILGCVMMLISVVGLLHQLRTHLKLRAAGVAEEQAQLAYRLPPDQSLPHVVVQIPSFNEGAIIQRSIGNLLQLDWPMDKLHIQVCDDSTDDTTALARSAAERARAAGFDVTVLHRSDRTDFKAGALQNAMGNSPYEYFAILDVDYLPASNFLRRCMAALLSAPKLAFVQARTDFLNPNENWLTRAQTIMLDYHYGLEQPTRSWAGDVLPFNGTCGIWRRAAIEAGGGWRGDMLCEDWDLSYRAWLVGWRGIFLHSVSVVGELPTKLRAWVRQQNRWATGVGQVVASMLPLLLRDHRLSEGQRRGALFPLALWIGHVSFAATLFPAVAAVLLKPSIALPFALGVYAVYLIAVVALYVGMLIAQRFVGRSMSLLQYSFYFQIVPYLMLYTSWQNLRSVPATLLGRRRVFERTPKTGSVAQPL
jgi:cellulose synthase/poly-beta-1,6-N-acetylglucosamine synthase-like glycosyltransferase